MKLWLLDNFFPTFVTMTHKIQIGISTCPNDTFAFHALLNNKIDTGDIEFDFQLLDVEELNERLIAGEFDVSKASFHAAVYLTEQLAVLSSGSALGFGVGPLLLAAAGRTDPTQKVVDKDGVSRSPKIACPGKHTTATLLYKIFYSNQGALEQMIFSDIMPQLKSATVDFGVCIHEGRFTYREEGLGCVADLGVLWEEKTGLPLPLGGILVRKKLGHPLMERIQKLVQASIEYGLANRDETLATMKQYAQEFSDDVLFAHVDTYVNDWTIELGELGGQALQKLLKLTSESEGRTFEPFQIVR